MLPLLRKHTLKCENISAAGFCFSSSSLCTACMMRLSLLTTVDEGKSFNYHLAKCKKTRKREEGRKRYRFFATFMSVVARHKKLVFVRRNLKLLRIIFSSDLSLHSELSSHFRISKGVSERVRRGDKRKLIETQVFVSAHSSAITIKK
jgi:predicted amidophosphoribosyltransferase